MPPPENATPNVLVRCARPTASLMLGGAVASGAFQPGGDAGVGLPAAPRRRSTIRSSSRASTSSNGAVLVYFLDAPSDVVAMIFTVARGPADYCLRYKTDASGAFAGVLPLTVCSTRMEVILEC